MAIARGNLKHKLQVAFKFIATCESYQQDGLKMAILGEIMLISYSHYQILGIKGMWSIYQLVQTEYCEARDRTACMSGQE